MSNDADYTESLKCPICFEVAEDPMECQDCHNIFCRKCIGWANGRPKVKACPMCRKPSNFKDSVFAKRLINNMEFPCPNDCGMHFSRADLSAHAAKCQKFGYECILCEFKGNRSDFWDHLKLKHENDIVKRFNNKEPSNTKSEIFIDLAPQKDRSKSTMDVHKGGSVINNQQNPPPMFESMKSAMNFGTMISTSSFNLLNPQFQNDTNMNMNPSMVNQRVISQNVIFNPNPFAGNELKGSMQVGNNNLLPTENQLNNTGIPSQSMQVMNMEGSNLIVNSNGDVMTIGLNGIYYCGKPSNLGCGCCPNVCGPSDGCPCPACMKVNCSIKMLPQGVLINKNGKVCTFSRMSYYCGCTYIKETTNVTGRVFQHEIQCQYPYDCCKSCAILTRLIPKYLPKELAKKFLPNKGI